MSSIDSTHPRFESLDDAFLYTYKSQGIKISTLLGLISSNKVDTLATAIALIIDRYDTTMNFANLNISPHLHPTSTTKSNYSKSDDVTDIDDINNNYKDHNNQTNLQIGTIFDEIDSITFLGLNQGRIPLSSSYYLPYIALSTYSGDLINLLGILRKKKKWTTGEEFLNEYFSSPYHNYKETFLTKCPHIPAERHGVFFFIKSIEIVFCIKSNSNNTIMAHPSQEYIYHWLGVSIHDRYSFLFMIGMTNLEYIYSFFAISHFLITQSVLTANYLVFSTLLSTSQLSRVRYIIDDVVIQHIDGQVQSDVGQMVKKIVKIKQNSQSQPLQNNASSSKLVTINPQNDHYVANLDPYGDTSTIHLDLFSFLPAYAQPNIMVMIDPHYTNNPATNVNNTSQQAITISLTQQSQLRSINNNSQNNNVNNNNNNNVDDDDSHESYNDIMYKNQFEDQYIMPEHVYIQLKSVHPLLSLIWSYTYQTDSATLLPTEKMSPEEIRNASIIVEAYQTHQNEFLSFFKQFWSSPLAVAVEVTTPTHQPLISFTNINKLKAYLELIVATKIHICWIVDKNSQKKHHLSNHSSPHSDFSQHNDESQPHQFWLQNWRKLWSLEDYYVLYHFVFGSIFTHHSAKQQLTLQKQHQENLDDDHQSDINKKHTKTSSSLPPTTTSTSTKPSTTIKKATNSTTTTTKLKPYKYHITDLNTNIDMLHDLINDFSSIGLDSTTWMKYIPNFDWKRHYQVNHTINNSPIPNIESTLSVSSSSLPSLEHVEIESSLSNSSENLSTQTHPQTQKLQTLDLPPLTIHYTQEKSLIYTNQQKSIYNFNPILPSVYDREYQVYQQQQYQQLPAFVREKYKHLLCLYLQYNLLPLVYYLINYTIPVIETPTNNIIHTNNSNTDNRNTTTLHTHPNQSIDSKNIQITHFVPYIGFINDILDQDNSIYSSLTHTYYTSIKTIQYLISNKVPIRFRKGQSGGNNQVSVLYSILLDNSTVPSLAALASNVQKSTKSTNNNDKPQDNLQSPTIITKDQTNYSNKTYILDYFGDFLGRNKAYSVNLTIYELFQILGQKNTKFWTQNPTTPHTDIITCTDLLHVIENIIMKQNSSNTNHTNVTNQSKQAQQKQDVRFGDAIIGLADYYRYPRSFHQQHPNQGTKVDEDLNSLVLQHRTLRSGASAAIHTTNNDYDNSANLNTLLESLIDFLDLRTITANLIPISSDDIDYQHGEVKRYVWSQFSIQQQKSYLEFISYVFYLFFHPNNLPIDVGYNAASCREFYAVLYRMPAWSIIVESILVTRNVNTYVQFILSGYQPVPSDIGYLMSSSNWNYSVGDINLCQVLHDTFYAMGEISKEKYQQLLQNENDQENEHKTTSQNDKMLHPMKDLPQRQSLTDAIDYFYKNPSKQPMHPCHSEVWGGFEPVLSPFWLKTTETLINSKIKNDITQYLSEIWNSPLGKIPSYNYMAKKKQLEVFLLGNITKVNIYQRIFDILTEKLNQSISDDNIDIGDIQKLLNDNNFVKKLSKKYRGNGNDENNEQRGKDKNTSEVNIDSEIPLPNLPKPSILLPSSPHHQIFKAFIHSVRYLITDNVNGTTPCNTKAILKCFNMVAVITTGVSLRQIGKYLNAHGSNNNTNGDGIGQINIDDPDKINTTTKNHPFLPYNKWFILDRSIADRPENVGETGVRPLVKYDQGNQQSQNKSQKSSNNNHIDKRGILKLLNQATSEVEVIDDPTAVEQDKIQLVKKPEAEYNEDKTGPTQSPSDANPISEKAQLVNALASIFNPNSSDRLDTHPNDLQYLINRAYLESLESIYLANRTKFTSIDPYNSRLDFSNQKVQALSQSIIKIRQSLKTSNGVNNENHSTQMVQNSTFLDLFFIILHGIGPSLPSFFLQGYFQSLPFNSSNYLCYLLWLYMYPQNTVTQSLHYIPMMSFNGGVNHNDQFLTQLSQRFIIDDMMRRMYMVPLTMNDIDQNISSLNKAKNNHVDNGSINHTDNMDNNNDTVNKTGDNVDDNNKFFALKKLQTFSSTSLQLYLEQLQRSICFLIIACVDVITTSTKKALKPQNTLLDDDFIVLEDKDIILNNKIKQLIATTNRPFFTPIRALINTTHFNWFGRKALPNTILLDNITILIQLIESAEKYAQVLTQMAVHGRDEDINDGSFSDQLNYNTDINLAFSMLIDVTLRTLHSSSTIIPNLLHLLLAKGYPLPNDIYPQFSLNKDISHVGNSHYWWVKHSPIHFYNFASTAFYSKSHYYIALLIANNNPNNNNDQVDSSSLIPTHQQHALIRNQKTNSMIDGLLSPLQLNTNYISSVLAQCQDDRFFILDRLKLFLTVLLKESSTSQGLIKAQNIQNQNVNEQANENSGIIDHLIKTNTSILGQNYWFALAGTYQPRLFSLIIAVLSSGLGQHIKSTTHNVENSNTSTNNSSSAFLWNLQGILQSDFLECNILHHFISKSQLQGQTNDYYNSMNNNLEYLTKNPRQAIVSSISNSDSHSGLFGDKKQQIVANKSNGDKNADFISSKQPLDQNIITYEQTYDTNTSNLLRYFGSKLDLDKSSYIIDNDYEDDFASLNTTTNSKMANTDENNNKRNKIITLDTEQDAVTIMVNSLLQRGTHPFETRSSLFTSTNQISIFAPNINANIMKSTNSKYYFNNNNVKNQQNQKSLFDLVIVPTLPPNTQTVPQHAFSPIKYSKSDHQFVQLYCVSCKTGDNSFILQNNMDTTRLTRSPHNRPNRLVGLTAVMDELNMIDDVEIQGCIKWDGNIDQSNERDIKTNFASSRLPTIVTTSTISTDTNKCDDSGNDVNESNVQASPITALMTTSLDTDESEVLFDLLTFIKRGFYQCYGNEVEGDLDDGCAKNESQFQNTHKEDTNRSFDWVREYQPLHQYRPEIEVREQRVDKMTHFLENLTMNFLTQEAENEYFDTYMTDLAALVDENE